MEEFIGFNIYEQSPTKEDIKIIYNPNTNYQSYKVTIYKDNEIYKEINKINMQQTEFVLSETGTYQIEITYYDEFMQETKEYSGIYNIDKDIPVLTIEKNFIEINLGKKLNIMENVTAADDKEGNLTNNITTNINEINMNTPGVKKLIYKVSDQAGNIAEKEVVINVVKPSPTVFIFQTIFTIILFIILIALLIYNKSTKLERKISKFSISPIKDDTLSLFDNLALKQNSIIERLNKILYKSEFAKKYSRRYSKYIRTTNQIKKSSMDYISTKILVAIICVIIAIFSKTIHFKIFRIYDIYIPLLFGFFLPDFIYYFKYKNYKKKMENDLLQAIIIMNNAFKSGRSITQAIELVSNELDGMISEEFKKIYLELSFGLGLDVVFKRFSERIKIEEVSYLTASLTILNQTGGNIVEVFSSIEKSLFNKKKLRLELQSLTGGSRMIVNILEIVPIAFIALIQIINPTYFLPLLTNEIGYLIIILALIYYIAYIIVIRKLLKVKI